MFNKGDIVRAKFTSSRFQLDEGVLYMVRDSYIDADGDQVVKICGGPNLPDERERWPTAIRFSLFKRGAR